MDGAMIPSNRDLNLHMEMGDVNVDEKTFNKFLNLTCILPLCVIDL